MEMADARKQSGHRGSHPAITRAIASRVVAKESAKWRSGRAVERTGWTNPSRRGGKTPYAFRDDEGVATKDYGDVVVPTRERTTLVVIEAELALELFVRSLGAPPLFGRADDLLLAHPARQRRERELRRSTLRIGSANGQGGSREKT